MIARIGCVLIGACLMAFFGIVITIETINWSFEYLFAKAAAEVEAAREHWIGAVE